VSGSLIAARPTTRCAATALALGEDLRGSAPRADGWLLVEHPGPWGPAGFADSGFPEAVVTEVVARTAAAGVRVQLVRRHAVRHDAPCTRVVLGSSRPGASWLRSFEVADASGLSEVPIEAVTTGRAPTAGRPVAGDVWLVCTHGRRDACCAEYGRVVAARLAAMPGVDVYETTHTGGHRFAANVVVLPDGLVYGRVTDEVLEPLLSTHASRRVLLHHVRGRACLDEWGQVAEAVTREVLGLAGIDDVLVDTVSHGDEEAVVTLFAGGYRYRVTLAREPTGELRSVSCADDSLRDPGRIVVTELIAS
jgi:hypothetical protein